MSNINEFIIYVIIWHTRNYKCNHLTYCSNLFIKCMFPHRCQIGWQQGLPGEENKLSLDMRATDTLNLNVTKALIDEYNKTKEKWTRDYYRAQR